MRTIGLAIAATSPSIALVATAAYVWWSLPDISIERQGSVRALMHMERLGEYPADVASIEIRESATSKRIWLARPDGGMAQIHSLSFQTGLNSAEPDVHWGKLRRVDGIDAPTFTLVARTAYTVKVCAPSFLPLCRSQHFSIDRTRTDTIDTSIR